jgi:hypothetical protein
MEGIHDKLEGPIPTSSTRPSSIQIFRVHPRIVPLNARSFFCADFQWAEGVPWIETMVCVTDDNPDIPDVHNDLERELAFYNQVSPPPSCCGDGLDTQE